MVLSFKGKTKSVCVNKIILLFVLINSIFKPNNIIPSFFHIFFVLINQMKNLFLNLRKKKNIKEKIFVLIHIILVN